MGDVTGTPPLEPWQYCWQCGRPLWDWSTVFEQTTFLGRLILCRLCAQTLKDVQPIERREGLLGYHDRATWKNARRRGN